jgi:uncharacterized membrane protein YhhN
VIQAILSLLILTSASLHIRAEYRGQRRQVYVFKPLTTTLIVVLALTAKDPVSPFYRAMIATGLIFSLGGDVFLMLPSDRFIWGLISFLIAHLFYIIAFVYPDGIILSPIFLALYLVYGGVMVRQLWPHIGGLRFPVLVYMSVILIMGWQALGRWSLLQTNAALLAAIGATLFVISDSVLALDRFQSRFASARLIVLSTYFGAQWLLALSVNNSVTNFVTDNGLPWA